MAPTFTAKRLDTAIMLLRANRKVQCESQALIITMNHVKCRASYNSLKLL